MGLLDFLLGPSKCPRCGTTGARKSQGQTRCPNPSCPFFDISLRSNPKSARLRGISPVRQGGFSPESPLTIRYRNFRGEEKTFIADSGSLRRTRNHIIARVAPTGESISLCRDRIQNLQEVESALPKITDSQPSGPTARERQVLGFHKKHKSTSPLYEEIRLKYPDW
jgi:hypothetical protein